MSKVPVYVVTMEIVRARNFWLWLSAAMTIVWLCGVNAVYAEIPQPNLPPDANADDLVSVIIGYFKLIAEAAMIMLLVIAFVVAAYAGIVALYRLISDRDGWATLLGVFFGALVVLAFVGWILYEGDQTLQTVTNT